MENVLDKEGLLDHVYGGTLFFEIAAIAAAVLIAFSLFHFLMFRADKPRKRRSP
jgi:hypothetical protein